MGKRCDFFAWFKSRKNVRKWSRKIKDFFLISFQIIAPQFKHFQKLRDFVEMKLPPGFPVKVDIPVLPTVSARVTFRVSENCTLRFWNWIMQNLGLRLKYCYIPNWFWQKTNWQHTMAHITHCMFYCLIVNAKQDQ